MKMTGKYLSLLSILAIALFATTANASGDENTIISKIDDTNHYTVEVIFNNSSQYYPYSTPYREARYLMLQDFTAAHLIAETTISDGAIKNVFRPEGNASYTVADGYNQGFLFVIEAGTAETISLTLPMSASGEIDAKPITISYAAPEQMKWTKCASEGETCQVSQDSMIRYGAQGSYIYLNSTVPFTCGISTFSSDPKPNVLKSCEVSDVIPELGTKIMCAGEGQVCKHPGEDEIAIFYGANDQKKYQRTKNDLTCNTATFGEDPAPNVHKTCYYFKKDEY